MFDDTGIFKNKLLFLNDFIYFNNSLKLNFRIKVIFLLSFNSMGSNNNAAFTRMLNLVDPSYELLDPTPDIHAQFVSIFVCIYRGRHSLICLGPFQ